MVINNQSFRINYFLYQPLLHSQTNDLSSLMEMVALSRYLDAWDKSTISPLCDNLPELNFHISLIWFRLGLFPFENLRWVFLPFKMNGCNQASLKCEGWARFKLLTWWLSTVSSFHLPVLTKSPSSSGSIAQAFIGVTLCVMSALFAWPPWLVLSRLSHLRVPAASQAVRWKKEQGGEAFPGSTLHCSCLSASAMCFCLFRFGLWDRRT